MGPWARPMGSKMAAGPWPMGPGSWPRAIVLALAQGQGPGFGPGPGSRRHLWAHVSGPWAHARIHIFIHKAS